MVWRTTEWVFVLALVLLHVFDAWADAVAASSGSSGSPGSVAAAAAAAGRRQPHVLFVCLPWRGHVNALRSVARALVGRGFHVAFALPDESVPWLADDAYEVVPTGPVGPRLARVVEQPWLQAALLLRTNASSAAAASSSTASASASRSASGYSNAHLHAAADADDTGAAAQHPPHSHSHSSASSSDAAPSSHSSASAAAAAAALLQQQQHQQLNANTLAHNAAVAALSKTLVQYQRAMLAGLTRRLQTRKPSLMVVDRFTWAGFDVASAFNVSYVVNNPHVLLDIDDPPSYYPAPYSYASYGLSGAGTGSASAPASAPTAASTASGPGPRTLWERLWNLLQRLSVRIAMLRHALFAVNADRAYANARTETHNAQYPTPPPSASRASAYSASSLGGPAVVPSDAPPAMADDIDSGSSSGPDSATTASASGSASSPSPPGYSRPLVPMLASLRDLHAGRLVLTNTVFGFEYARALVPRFRMVGPLFPANPEPLQPKLQAWLDDASQKQDDVFYVNLGDDDAALLDSAQTNNLLTGLLALKKSVRLLWVLSSSARARLLPDPLPSNVRVMSYVAQLSALAHPAVRLSVTHATLTAAQEALYHAKPVLLIPFYADQYEVAVRAAQAGCGLLLAPHDTHSVRAVSLAVHQLLSGAHGKGFAQGALRMSHLLRASGGAREAATLIELVSKLGTGFVLTPHDVQDAAVASDSAHALGHVVWQPPPSSSAHYPQQQPPQHIPSGAWPMTWTRALSTLVLRAQLAWWDVYAMYFVVVGLMVMGVRQCWATLNALIAPLPPLPPHHHHAAGLSGGGVGGVGGGLQGLPPLPPLSTSHR